MKETHKTGYKKDADSNFPPLNPVTATYYSTRHSGGRRQRAWVDCTARLQSKLLFWAKQRHLFLSGRQRTAVIQRASVGRRAGGIGICQRPVWKGWKGWVNKCKSESSGLYACWSSFGFGKRWCACLLAWCCFTRPAGL